MTEPFSGAKIAILVSDHVLAILRDDFPTIPWPGMWDLPGGERDGTETPTECALRETKEELGLTLPEHKIVHARACPAGREAVWFLAAEWPDFNVADVVFGDEGQEWRLAPIDWFLNHEKTIPHMRENLRAYLEVR